jgi:hypothetical protein
VSLEVLRRLFRLFPGKVTLVRHPPDDEKPPGIGLQLRFRGRRQNEREFGPVDVRKTRVTAADVHLEPVARVLAHREHQTQFFFGIVIDTGALQVIGDGLAAPKNLPFFVRRPHHIERRAAG